VCFANNELLTTSPTERISKWWLMSRPESVQDVLALIRRSRLVSDARLAAFLELLNETGLATARTAVSPASMLSPAAVLSMMIAQGLLTSYQANELAAGRCEFRIGGYLILELLGRGGMGHVFLAEHELLGKRVALKVLASGDRSDESACERFVREAQAAAALDHPNIVRVLNVNVAHDPPYLVMEYVDGISLQAAVARHGTFTSGEAAAVGVQVAMGLQKAAEVRLVHRDIKPANVLIDRLGGVKILDLGIARFATDPVSRLVDTQTVIGTLDYLAPEQAIDSSHVDSRADLYSLGATLFFLLAGHPPFADDDVNRKIVRKQHSNPPSIAAYRLDIPPGLAAVINRLLARSASDRYPTPTAAALALKPWSFHDGTFPERFFRPWQSAPSDLAGQAAAAGDDPSPTPLPPTRRILRSQTERRTGGEPTPDTTPMPGGPSDATHVFELPEPAQPMQDSGMLIEAHRLETGSPTIALTVAPPPKPWANLGRKFWLTLGGLAAAAIGAALLARLFA
jgi:eukaryotic-like serine/threonine-protein kinase